MTVKSNRLAELRVWIDAIDDQMIDLLEQRMELVERVAECKRSESGQVEGDVPCSFVRPGREASMVRALVEKAHGIYPPEAIVAIWRQIIGASLKQEQGMAVSLVNRDQSPHAYWMARSYWGDGLEARFYDNAEAALAAVAAGDASLTVLALENTHWWEAMQKHDPALTIFARLPFVAEEHMPAVFAIGRVHYEASGEDRTVIALPAGTVLPGMGIELLQYATDGMLVTVPGMEVDALPDGAYVLGHYATPMKKTG